MLARDVPRRGVLRGAGEVNIPVELWRLEKKNRTKRWDFGRISLIT